MTTIDTAAVRGVWTKALLAALIAGIGLALGGCETGASLFSSSSSDNSSIAASTPAPAETAQIAVAPVFGPSEGVAKTLHTQMVSAIEAKNIVVAKTATQKAPYTLRGYFLSSKKGSKTSISYVWDVTDPTGKRLNRIAGEELVPQASGRDPWGAVTPQIAQQISSKTAANLSAWLPKVAPASPPPASTGTSPQFGPGSPNNGNIPMASRSPSAGTIPATPTATGSIGRAGAVTAMVPAVSGAPGGGSVELTNAIQRQLKQKGVTLGASNQAYRVEGRVTVGAVSNGKQPIEIEWLVKDPTGKKLGTVSQRNNIAAGSLDGPWGKVADMVAEAAVKRIVELLPSQVSSAG